MKKLAVVVGVVCATGNGAARAEVSEDLKFCSALRSTKERLACYDAAVRLAGRAPGVAVPATVTRPSLPVANASQPPLKKSKFGGFYAGVTGGYEGAISTPNLVGARPVVPVDSLKGAKVGGVLGYNAESDALLMGFEARGQYSFSKAQISSTNNINSGIVFPYTHQSLTCFGCTQEFLNNYPTNVGPVFLNSTDVLTAARSHQWQIDFSARWGITFGETLFFAKAGLGAEDALSINRLISTVTTCDPAVVRQRPSFNSVAIVVTGCNGRSSSTTTVNLSERTIAPIAILGGGLERNFGSYFLRAEGEFTAHFIKGAGIYYSPSANLTGGYRF